MEDFVLKNLIIKKIISKNRNKSQDFFSLINHINFKPREIHQRIWYCGNDNSLLHFRICEYTRNFEDYIFEPPNKY